MTLKSELDALALTLVKQAGTVEVTISVDIFKAVVAYHLGTAKVKIRDGDGADPTTFADILKKIPTSGGVNDRN